MKQLFDREMKQFLVELSRIRPGVFRFDKTIFYSHAGKQQSCYMMKYQLILPPEVFKLALRSHLAPQLVPSISVRV